MAYTKLTDFAVKDALLTGNPAKVVRGTEIDAELNAIAAADALNLSAASIVAATSKPTPIDADLLPLVDSAASNVLKKLTWANLKATAKTYFDTLYLGISATATNASQLLGKTWASPDPIGSTTPNTGAFTNLSASGNVTLGDSSTDTLNVGNGGLIKDAAGYVGIGATPSAWSGYRALDLGNAAAFATAGSTADVVQNAYHNGTNWIYKTTAPASLCRQQDGINDWFSAPSGTAGDPISFTRTMTLDADGTLALHGKFGPTNGFDFVQDNVGWGGAAQYFNHPAGVTSGARYAIFTYNGVEIGSITQSGTTAVAYNTTSDHRLKENVRDADATRFMDIQFRDFEWVDGRHDCGVIAHELQQVYPDLVLGEKDATEVRTVEITPAVPAVTEQVLVTPEVPTVYDGDQIVTPGVAAVYETIEVTPAVPAVTEQQTFPVYQQVNYTGLIGRMGTRVQDLQRAVYAQAALIEAMELRLAALEVNV